MGRLRSIPTQSQSDQGVQCVSERASSTHIRAKNAKLPRSLSREMGVLFFRDSIAAENIPVAKIFIPAHFNLMTPVNLTKYKIQSNRNYGFICNSLTISNITSRLFLLCDGVILPIEFPCRPISFDSCPIGRCQGRRELLPILGAPPRNPSARTHQHSEYFRRGVARISARVRRGTASS